LKIWDITNNPPQLIKEIAVEDVWSGQADYVGRYAIWNPDGQTISVFSQMTFKTWNIESGSLIDSGKIPVELSPNRQYRWSKTNDTITIIDVKTNRQLNHFQLNGGANSLRWSLDGLVLFAQVHDDNLIMWNSQGNSISQFPIYPNYGVDYLSASNQYLIMGNRFDIAHIWDMTNQKQIKDLNFYPTAARFSPDGKYLAAAADNQITIWSTADFK
jgi:WD40 repeat protein